MDDGGGETHSLRQTIAAFANQSKEKHLYSEIEVVLGLYLVDHTPTLEEDNGVDVSECLAANEIRNILVQSSLEPGLSLYLTQNFCKDEYNFLHSVMYTNPSYFESLNHKHYRRDVDDDVMIIEDDFDVNRDWTVVLKDIILYRLKLELDTLLNGKDDEINDSTDNQDFLKLLKTMRLTCLYYSVIQQQWTEDDSLLILKIIFLIKLDFLSSELVKIDLNDDYPMIDPTHNNIGMLFCSLLIMANNISVHYEDIFFMIFQYLIFSDTYFVEGFLTCLSFKMSRINNVFGLLYSFFDVDVSIPPSSLQVISSFVNESVVSNDNAFFSRILILKPRSESSSIAVYNAIKSFSKEGVFHDGKALWEWIRSNLDAISKCFMPASFLINENQETNPYFSDFCETREFYESMESIITFSFTKVKLGIFNHCITNQELSDIVMTDPYDFYADKRINNKKIVEENHLRASKIILSRSLYILYALLCKNHIDKSNMNDIDENSFEENIVKVDDYDGDETTYEAKAMVADISFDGLTNLGIENDNMSNSSSNDDIDNKITQIRASDSKDTKSLLLLSKGYNRLLNALPLKRFYLELVNIGTHPILETRLSALLSQLYPETIDLNVMNIVEVQYIPKNSLNENQAANFESSLNDSQINITFLKNVLVDTFWIELGYDSYEASLKEISRLDNKKFVSALCTRVQYFANSFANNRQLKDLSIQITASSVFKFLSKAREYLEVILLGNEYLHLLQYKDIIFATVSIFRAWLISQKYKNDCWANGWNVIWTYSFYCSPQETLFYTLAFLNLSKGGNNDDCSLIDWDIIADIDIVDKKGNALKLEALNIFSWSPHLIFKELSLFFQVSSTTTALLRGQNTSSMDNKKVLKPVLSIFETVFLPSLRYVTVLSRNRTQLAFNKHSIPKRDTNILDILSLENNGEPSLSYGQFDKEFGPNAKNFSEINLESLLLLQEASLVQLLLESLSKVIDSVKLSDVKFRTLPLSYQLGLDLDSDSLLSLLPPESKTFVLTTCQYLHGVFIENQVLLKLVIFQGIPLNTIKILISLVPSFHVILEYIEEFLRFASGSRRLLRYSLILSVELCYKYPISNSVEKLGHVWSNIRQILDPLCLLSDRMVKVFDEAAIMERIADINDAQQMTQVIENELNGFKENYISVKQNIGLHIVALNLFPTISMTFPDLYLNLCKEYLISCIPNLNKLDEMFKNLLLGLPGFEEYVNLLGKVEKGIKTILEDDIYKDSKLLVKSLR